MPKDDKLKLGTRDKVVQKMTRDGAELQNISKGISQRISDRLADGEIKKERAADVRLGSRGRESPSYKESNKKRRQAQRTDERGFKQKDDSRPEKLKKSQKAASYRLAKDEKASAITEIKEEKKSGYVGYVVSDAIHGKVDEETDDNVGVEATHRSEQAAERLLNQSGDKPQKKRLKRKSVRERSLREERAAGGETSLKEQQIRAEGIKEEKAEIFGKDSGNQKQPIRKKTSRLRDEETANKISKLEFDSRLRKPKAVSDSVRARDIQKPHTSRSRLRFEPEEQKTASTVKKPIPAQKSQKLYYTAENRASCDNIGSIPEAGGKSGSGEGGKINKNKAVQRKRLKRGYATAYRNKKRGVRGYKPGVGSAAMEAFTEIEKEPVKTFFSEHKATILIAIFFFFVLFVMITGVGSIGIMMMSGGESFVQSTYLSSDDAITSTSDTYAAKEEALRNKIDKIPENYPGYDEYRYDLDEIKYDPYVLTSYLTAVFKEYELSDVGAELQSLFEAQYTLTLTSITETRYDSDGDPYPWHVLQVTLTNNGLDTVVASRMDEDQRKAYDLYQENCGNRSYLFGGGAGGGAGTGGVPAGLDFAPTDEALLDARFAGMIAEADKYIGYPYVWGGSSPSTSFDCSGFVCWVINHSVNGWDVGRTTANGLVGSTARVSEPKAGDLIFFQGTYDTAGASHVGIVVDPENKIMVHAGNPIQYASYDTTYWRQHFMCYGRLP